MNEHFLFILSIFFTTSALGQSNDTSKFERFVVGDRLIECNNCKIDFCGNLINLRGDTIAQTTKPYLANDKPIFITDKNVLLSSGDTKKLSKAKKIKSVVVFNCNKGRILFGDVAKNGIIVIELINDLLDTISLQEYISINLKKAIRKSSKIYINNLETKDNRLKLIKQSDIRIKYDLKTNSYNLKIE